jgi:hypothetical protein
MNPPLFYESSGPVRLLFAKSHVIARLSCGELWSCGDVDGFRTQRSAFSTLRILVSNDVVKLIHELRVGVERARKVPPVSHCRPPFLFRHVVAPYTDVRR